MNATKQLQQIKLDQWAVVLCQAQIQSGLTVKQQYDQNGYTIHTYNHWKHRHKENFVESALHNIVPITPPVPGVLPNSHDSAEDLTFTELYKPTIEILLLIFLINTAVIPCKVFHKHTIDNHILGHQPPCTICSDTSLNMRFLVSVVPPAICGVINTFFFP